jgi:hypothetical protein
MPRERLGRTQRLTAACCGCTAKKRHNWRDSRRLCLSTSAVRISRRGCNTTRRTDSPLLVLLGRTLLPTTTRCRRSTRASIGTVIRRQTLAAVMPSRRILGACNIASPWTGTSARVKQEAQWIPLTVRSILSVLDISTTTFAPTSWARGVILCLAFGRWCLRGRFTIRMTTATRCTSLRSQEREDRSTLRSHV